MTNQEILNRFYAAETQNIVGFAHGDPFTTQVNADRTTQRISSAVVAMERNDLVIIETDNQGVAFYSNNNHAYYYWKDYGTTWAFNTEDLLGVTHE